MNLLSRDNLKSNTILFYKHIYKTGALNMNAIFPVLLMLWFAYNLHQTEGYQTIHASQNNFSLREAGHSHLVPGLRLFELDLYSLIHLHGVIKNRKTLHFTYYLHCFLTLLLWIIYSIQSTRWFSAWKQEVHSNLFAFLLFYFTMFRPYSIKW
jgi:hypothetical protein